MVKDPVVYQPKVFFPSPLPAPRTGCATLP
jgi:hypothetical protein